MKCKQKKAEQESKQTADLLPSPVGTPYKTFPVNITVSPMPEVYVKFTASSTFSRTCFGSEGLTLTISIFPGPGPGPKPSKKDNTKFLWA